MLTQANLSNEQALGTACAFFAGLQRLLRAHLHCERSPAREVPWVSGLFSLGRVESGSFRGVDYPHLQHRNYRRQIDRIDVNRA